MEIKFLDIYKSVMLYFSTIILSTNILYSQNLPNDIPEKLSIHYFAHNSNPETSIYFNITGDTCYIHHTFDDETTDTFFIFSKNDLKELYNIFLVNKFDEITCYEGCAQIYEDGVSITLFIDDKVIRKSNLINGSSIKHDDLERFNNIAKEMLGFIHNTNFRQ